MKNIILLGAPNAGKSSVFNALTHLKAKTVNYPGSTVDFLIGSWNQAKVIDTPGIYCLDPLSDDEKLTCQILQGKSPIGNIDSFIVVVDVTQIKRQIALVHQLKKMNKPFVVIFTMKDFIERLDLKIDTQALSRAIGVPTFLVTSAHLSKDQELQKDIWTALNSWPAESVKNDVDERLLGQILEGYQKGLSQGVEHWSLRMDRWLLHPILGVLFFMVIMLGLFSSIFWVADPMIGWIEAGIELLAESIHQLPDFWSKGFLTSAVLPGFGAFLVFIPQIFTLFLLMQFLEASGYLARAALMLDALLMKFGMSGRAFVPLLSGFACAIPASMAARNLSNARERRIVRWVLPLLTCSARIPVFVIFVSLMLPEGSALARGLVLFGFYILSLLVAAFAAWVIHRLLSQELEDGVSSSWLMLDLPWYRRPSIGAVAWQAGVRSWQFVTRAGPVIFILSLMIWLLSSYPKTESGEAPELASSYIGQAGLILDPVFEPMGGDWRTGVGILAAFAAREVFVSTLATLFGMEEEGGAFLETLKGATRKDGQLLFSVPSIWALVIFFIIALQCLSTVAVQASETRSWSFALLQLGVFNLAAYILAILVYQSLSILGF